MMTQINGNTILKEITGEDWLVKLRHEGLLHFERYGLPTKSVEKWKYTSLKPLANVNFTPNIHLGMTFDAKRLPAPLLTVDTEPSTARIVIVNGVYREDLSDLTMLPTSGVTLASLDKVLANEPDWMKEKFAHDGYTDDQVMLALNTHFFTDGYVLHVHKGVQLRHPIEVICYGDGRDDALNNAPTTYPRHLIVLDEGAQATVVEHHLGDHAYIANKGYDIEVGNNATLHHYRLQNESQHAYHIATTNVNLAQDASYDGFTLTTGGKVSRNEVHGRILGENSELRVNGAYLLKDQQHGDTTILVDHLQPNGVSNQTFKGILDDHAKGVFQGKVFVDQIAQKTDGYQLNNALMLSETAEMNVKPELEIYADDVRCSHGATTGQIDDGPLFYLRSRGLNEAQARKMLMQAFLGEALDEIRHETVRDLFTDIAAAWLEKRVK